MRYLTSSSLAACLLCVVSPQPAHAADPLPGLVSAINAIREQGCAQHSAPAIPLLRDPRLDRAAQALAAGRRLADAVQDAGYIALQSAALTASGSQADIARTLADDACRDIADPAYREFGIASRPGRAWIVLAAPLVPPAANEAEDVGRRVLELVNDARASPRRCGWKRFDAAAPLVPSDALQRAALEHAQDMASRGNLSHTGGDGSTHAERATRAGYPWRVVGENIAAGQSTAERVVAGWLKSAGHCANLMDPDFSEMGVAYAAASRDAKGVYWVQMFAAPRQ